MSLPPLDLETIDLTMPLPPASPSEDPILLKGKRLSKPNHSTPTRRQSGRGTRGLQISAQQHEVASIQMSTPTLSDVDDTFVGRPRRGDRLTFKDLNQGEADESEIENPVWILSDPPMEMNVETQRNVSVELMNEGHAELELRDQNVYFDVQMDLGFGSDDDDEVPRGTTTDRSEVVPSSDAEEGANIKLV
jgi:hypothetical protein